MEWHDLSNTEGVPRIRYPQFNYCYYIIILIVLRHGHASTVLGRELYILGGTPDYNNNNYFDDMHHIDISMDSFHFLLVVFFDLLH